MSIRQTPTTPHIAVLTFEFLGTLLLGFLVLVAMIWLWGAFLDVHEHCSARIRSAMLLILCATTACELAFASNELIRPWVAVVVLIVNIWGGLDALLRFPADHAFESFFSLKQFLLLAAKTLSYGFGIGGFRHHLAIFIVSLLVIVWSLPVLYLMAMPLDPSEQVVADELDDVDLVLRVWRLTTCRKERQRCGQRCKNWLHKHVVATSEKMAIAKIALCAASPAYQRAFTRAQSRGCRSV